MIKIKHNQRNLNHFYSLFIIIGFLFCGAFTQVHAVENSSVKEFEQTTTITGNVVSADDNMSLPGVNVFVKGTKNGVVTDFDGNYTINNVASDAVLVYSFIGFSTQEVPVNGKSTVNIVLQVDAQALDEVVIVGFGTQRKATLTGSVTQVKGSDVLASKGTSNAALSLQGEIPGLVITKTSSRPGNEGIDIKIRGDISVNGISPLILLDGLEIPEWQLATINANDIETYSVLKDGSAAIFGTKAAGGVILITTKKGKIGAPKITYKAETQINIPKDFPTANLKEWAQLWITAGDNDGHTYLDSNGDEQYAAPNYRFFQRDELVSIIDGTMPMAPDTYFWLGQDRYLSDENQFDAIYGNTVSQRHDLSISGGSEKATYRTSLGYADERSPLEFVYDGAKRYNFRTNVSYKVSKLINVDLTTSYDNRTVNSPMQGVGHGVQDMYIFPLYNPEGQYYDEFGSNNLLAKLDEGGRDINREQIFRLGGKLTLDLDTYVKGLSLSYQGNLSSRNGRRNRRTTSVTMYDWFGNVSRTPTTLATSSIKVNQTEVLFQNHVMQANYNRSFGKHNLGLMVNATSEEESTNLFESYRKNMASDELDDIDTGDVTTQTNSGGSYAVGLVSYIGKFNYDYDGTFLLELMGRRDGSSRLDPDYRWKNFFGGSAGINFHELSFVKDLDFFDNLKLRVSYGETGSVTGIGRYDYISSISNGSTQFGSSPALANTAWIASLTSTDRSWERVSNTNFGLDFAILDRKLSGSVDVYSRENNDMLIPITYPAQLTASAPKTNSGDFTNNGFEIALNWKDQIGELKYNLGFMFWDSKSEVTRMEGRTSISRGLNTIVEGKPLNALYTYKTDGILSSDAEVLEYYNLYGFNNASDQNDMKTGTLLPAYRSANKLLPGNVRRVDVNGDGIINMDDLVYQGDANPHNSYGINLGLEYKGFDFSAFFQGVGKQNILRVQALAYPFRSWWTNQNSSFLGTTWTVDNQGAENPAAFYNGTRKNWNYGHPNDVNIIKANYLRAKILSLGYTIPEATVNKIGLDRVRLSVTGNDLFVLTNVKDGLDPEAATSAGQGSTTPFTSTILFGLEISL